MLSAGERFTLPGLDGVAMFPDDALAGGFYAVSTVPRVVLGEDGRPAVSLTVYGRRTAGVFAASGGILTVTTELAVTDEERVRVQRGLTARLAASWADPKSDPPRPQLLAVDWLEASVTVQLTAALLLTGQPSMSSTNQCSFSTKLTDAGAGALARAWKDGLADATITYSGRVRSGGAGLGVSRSSVSRSSSSSSVTTRSSVHTSSSSSSWGSRSSSAAGPDGAQASWTRRTFEEQPGAESFSAYSSAWESGSGVEADDPGPGTEPPSGAAPTTDGDVITGSARLADSVSDLRAHLVFVEL